MLATLRAWSSDLAHIYPHKKSGWRVLYRVYFPDGTHKERVRYGKKKYHAQTLFKEASSLEVLTRSGAASKDEITFFFNQGYITQEEAIKLAGCHIAGAVSWEMLRKKFEDWSRENCRGYTHACNMSRLEVVLSRIDKAPADLTVKDVEGYVSRRRGEERKSATILKELVVIRKLLDGINPEDNPARKVPLPKIDDERHPRVLSAKEIEQFFKVLENHKQWLYGYVKPLVLTYLYTGLRPSELINLTFNDLDLETRKLYVQAKAGYKTKTGKARSVEINKDIEPFLAGLKRGSYVFGGDRKLDSKSVSRAIRKLFRKAKLGEGVTPYSLRHSFATYMLKAGATLEEVRAKMGHARIATTAKYLHTIPDTESPVHRLDFGVKSGVNTDN